jgi:hypothetical protein
MDTTVALGKPNIGNPIPDIYKKKIDDIEQFIAKRLGYTPGMPESFQTAEQQYAAIEDLSYTEIYIQQVLLSIKH